MEMLIIIGCARRFSKEGFLLKLDRGVILVLMTYLHTASSLRPSIRSTAFAEAQARPGLGAKNVPTGLAQLFCSALTSVTEVQGVSGEKKNENA